MTTPAAARPIKVLLVEDNPGDAQYIFTMLRDASNEFDLQHVDHLETALDRHLREIVGCPDRIPVIAD